MTGDDNTYRDDDTCAEDDATWAEDDDTRADDNTPPNRVAKRWKRKSIAEKVLMAVGIVILAAIAWKFLAGRESAHRKAEISSTVKSSMQQDFNTDTTFAPYHLVVEKVVVLKQTQNQYQGIATVHSPKGINHEVSVDITADGNNILWRSEPGAFAWMVLEQLNEQVPTTGAPPGY